MKNLSLDNLIGVLSFTLSAVLLIFAAWRFREVRIAIRRLTVILIILIIPLVVIHFPYDSDTPARKAQTSEVEQYYTQEFAGEPEGTKSKGYLAFALQEEAMHEHIKRRVSDFVERYGVKQRHVLEIGAGTGFLQDVVDDYTGLDIAPTARRFFHKRFVAGSATALPFPDNEFDAIWSIYVYEHVTNPEQGFAESRRILRSGGLIFLMPFWNCTSWAADGYEVRPFCDFDLWGKMIKASLVIRAQPFFILSYRYPIRFLRLLSASFSRKPTQLRYKLLKPNFSKYWGPDSDAVNSIDRFEVLQWFLSRGDECLNCSVMWDFWYNEGPLILRINKPQ